MREYPIEYLPEVFDDIRHFGTRELQAIKAKIVIELIGHRSTIYREK